MIQIVTKPAVCIDWNGDKENCLLVVTKKHTTPVFSDSNGDKTSLYLVTQMERKNTKFSDWYGDKILSLS